MPTYWAALLHFPHDQTYWHWQRKQYVWHYWVHEGWNSQHLWHVSSWICISVAPVAHKRHWDKIVSGVCLFCSLSQCQDYSVVKPRVCSVWHFVSYKELTTSKSHTVVHVHDISGLFTYSIYLLLPERYLWAETRVYVSQPNLMWQRAKRVVRS